MACWHARAQDEVGRVKEQAKADAAANAKIIAELKNQLAASTASGRAPCTS